MKVRILGCGPAGGVPMISRGYGKCNPQNPKNTRLRSGLMIEADGLRFLIDTSPDLRAQLLACGTQHIDAVLFTHEHADHIHGVDELREINRAMQKPIPVYGRKSTLGYIAERFGYVFETGTELPEIIYKPWLFPFALEENSKFCLGRSITVEPILMSHGWMDVTAYKINNMAYCTDVVTMTDAQIERLAGLDLLIVGCITDRPGHPTHADFKTVLEWIGRIAPKHAVLTHMGTSLDYDRVLNECPENVVPAYDGLEVHL